MAQPDLEKLSKLLEEHRALVFPSAEELDEPVEFALLDEDIFGEAYGIVAKARDSFSDVETYRKTADHSKNLFRT